MAQPYRILILILISISVFIFIFIFILIRQSLPALATTGSTYLVGLTATPTLQLGHVSIPP